MLQEIKDFQEECDALYAVLAPLTQEQWQTTTQFKDWSIHDVVLHLHFSDVLALTTAKDSNAFSEALGGLLMAMGNGSSLMEYTREWMGEITGTALLTKWNQTRTELCEALASLEPKARLDWFGPSMGVRMFATARLMETWAHGQEIHDELGIERAPTDRIKHVCVLGVKTYAWTFANRSITPPGPMPYLQLRAPSGEQWEWGESSNDNVIKGDAFDFAQVVTQVRNIADTNLNVIGEISQQWMAIAQCFAGLPADPPPPGTRFLRKHPALQ
jgi:uncharacterized protein (TIGR03084 family)